MKIYQVEGVQGDPTGPGRLHQDDTDWVKP
jgi:hypothetical protein